MQNGEDKKKQPLDPLPRADDEFWPKDAENEVITLGKNLTCERGGHEFIYGKKATEARCKKCPVGYILSAGWEIRDGHIFAGEQRVI